MKIIKASEFGLEEKQGQSIELSFSVKVAEKEALTLIYNSLITEELSPELCVKAKDFLKKLVKVRTGISKVHKVEKAVSLAYGRFVDALKNKHTLSVEQMESKVKEIVNYYDNLEKERIDELNKERYAFLMPYLDEEAIPLLLGKMDDEIFNNYFTGVKLMHKTKLEAEAKAEAERLALVEKERLEKIESENERKRIEAENLKLKKEAEERERKILEEKLIEQKKAEKERLEREEKARVQLEKQNEILEAQRKEAQEKARIEAEKQAKIQAELQAKAEKAEIQKRKIAEELNEKAEVERLELEQKEKEAQKLLQRGDNEKYADLLKELKSVKTKYTFESVRYKTMFSSVKNDIDKIINNIS